MMFVSTFMFIITSMIYVLKQQWDPNSTIIAEFFRSLGIGVSLFTPKDFVQAIIEQQRLKPVVILLSQADNHPEFDDAQFTIFSLKLYLSF